MLTVFNMLLNNSGIRFEITYLYDDTDNSKGIKVKIILPRKFS